MIQCLNASMIQSCVSDYNSPQAKSMNPTHPSTLQLPAVPLTLEGYATLHQMMRFRWTAWRALAENTRREIAAEAASLLAAMEAESNGKSDGQSALFSLLGHKGDLMLVHFRESFDQLNQAELDLARLRLNDFLEPATSYLSVIELGLYESSLKTYKALADRGVEPHSDEWKKAIQETIARQKEAMKPRLFPAMPPNRYLCFYPMDRRRGEDKNWYTLPMEERKRRLCPLRKFLYRIALSRQPPARPTGGKLATAQLVHAILPCRDGACPVSRCKPEKLRCERRRGKPSLYGELRPLAGFLGNLYSRLPISTRAPRNVTPSIRRRNFCSAAPSPPSLMAPPALTTRCQGSPGTCCKMRTT